jgi:hypothetical protein
MTQPTSLAASAASARVAAAAEAQHHEDPVFTSTRQALHVSFMFEVMPATQKSQMQMLLERMMEQAGVTEELEPHERSIDFRGLTALEVRGQCAMVVASVGSHLSVPEIAAVWTRFGMRRRQADGVREFADYVQPMLTSRNSIATMAMIWGKFAREGRREDFSIRRIADECGLQRTTIERDQQRMMQCHKALENRAIERLDGYFKRTALVP